MSSRLLAVAVAIILLWGGGAAAAELALFTGRAEISLEELSLTAAREQARREALAEAVKEALRQIMPPEEYEMKDRELKKEILDHPSDYTVSFSVIEEKTGEVSYRVSLEARIDLARLREAVRAIKTPVELPDEKPALLFVPFKERAGGYAFLEEMDQPLRERFELADQTAAPAAEAEKLLGEPSFAKAMQDQDYRDLAQVVQLRGQRLLILIEVRDETPLSLADEVCDRRVVVRIVDATALALIVSFTYHFPTTGDCLSHGETAGGELFAALMDNLAGHGLLSETGSDEVIVELLGVGDYEQLLALRTMIRNRAYVQQADLAQFEPGGRIWIAVRYGGSIDQLANDLVAARTAGLALKPAGRRGNLLQYHVEYE